MFSFDINNNNNFRLMPRRAAMTRHRDCHAGKKQPGLAQRVAARKKRRQGFANIRSGGPLPRKHSPDGAT